MSAVPSSHSKSVSGGAAEIGSAGPILFLLFSGLAWLVVGLVFALVAAVKLQVPSFLAEFEFLAYGRIHAAAGCALVYGFAAQMGLGLALWLLVRLGETELVGTGLAGIGAAFWNLGLTLGIPGILGGQGTGIAWLELPSQVTPLMSLAYLTIAMLGAWTFFRRNSLRISNAQAYLFAALFWFPWIFSTAQFALVFFPVHGVLQAVIAGWYVQSLFLGWLTMIALGVLYALIPELTGRPLRHPEYAGLGFWGWLILVGWTAASSLIGGPVPAWVATVSVASGVLTLLPTVFISLNLHVGGRMSQLLSSPGLVLAVGATGAFSLSGLLNSVTSLRCAREILQFTQFQVGLQQLHLMGFVGLSLFAGGSVAIPRLLGRRLPLPLLSALHVLGSFVGIALMILPLMVGGWNQGFLLQGRTDAALILRQLQPWFALNALGVLVFLGAQLIWIVQLLVAIVQVVAPWGKPALSWVLAPIASPEAK